MIKIVDINASGISNLTNYKSYNYLRDVEKALADQLRGASLLILVHDAYNITKIEDRPNDCVYIKWNNEFKEISYKDLFLQTSQFIYNVADTRYPNLLKAFTDIDLYKLDYNRDTHIFIISKQVMDLYNDINIDTATLMNSIVYPNLSKILDFYNTNKANLSSLRRSISGYYLDNVIYNMKTRDVMRYNFHNHLTGVLIEVAIQDLCDIYITRNILDYKNTRFADNEASLNSIYRSAIMDEHISQFIELSLTAYISYTQSYNKVGFKEILSYIHSNVNDFGFGILLYYNYLESSLEGITIPGFDSQILTRYDKSATRRQFAESLRYFVAQRENTPAGPASQAFGLYATTTPNNPMLSELHENAIAPVVESADEINENYIQKLDNNTNVLHTIHYRRYKDLLDNYSAIRYFKDPEEKEKMTIKVANTIDELREIKNRLAMNNNLEYSDKIDVSLYDVLIDNAKMYIDYLQNIKYYGDDPSIGELNEEAYTSAENFKMLSIPIDYFLGVDIAQGERSYLYGGDDEALPGGVEYVEPSERSLWHKLRYGKEIRDKDGNFLRYRREARRMLNTTPEERKKIDKHIARLIKHPVNPSGSPIFHAEVRWFFNKIDEFFGGIRSLYRSLIFTITYGAVDESAHLPDDLTYVDVVRHVFADNDIEIMKAKQESANAILAELNTTIDEKYDILTPKPVRVGPEIVDTIEPHAEDLPNPVAIAKKAKNKAISSVKLLWVKSKISFLYLVVRPLVTAANNIVLGKTKSNAYYEDSQRFKNKLFKWNEEMYKTTDEFYNAAKGKLSDKDLEKISKVRDVFNMTRGTDNARKVEPVQESVRMDKINAIQTNKEVLLKSPSDINVLLIRLYNTLKLQKVQPYAIYLNEDRGLWCVFVMTDNSKYVFELRSYKLESPELASQIKRIQIGDIKIAVSNQINYNTVMDIIVKNQQQSKHKETQQQAPNDIKEIEKRTIDKVKGAKHEPNEQKDSR